MATHQKLAGGSTTTTAEEFDFWHALPPELSVQIMAHCDSIGDMLNLSMSCHLLYELFKDATNANLLWRVHAKKKYNLKRTKQQKNLNWLAYIKQYVALRRPGVFEWKKLSRGAAPSARQAHTGSAVDNKIYYVGGQKKRTRLDEIWCYDPACDTWSAVVISKGTVPKFARHRAVTWGDKILCFGGFDYTMFWPLAIFSPREGTWTYPETTGEKAAPVSNHGMTIVGKRLYVFGGSVNDEKGQYKTIDDFYYLDIETLEWHKIKSEGGPSPRIAHGMAGMGHNLYLFGGGVWDPNDGWKHEYTDVFIYDTVRNKWSELQLDLRPNISGYAYQFNIGTHICFFGGNSNTSADVEKDLWLFDTVSNKWFRPEVTGDLPSARSTGTANMVGNEVFIWGGYFAGTLPATDDFYKLTVHNVDLALMLWHDSESITTSC